jgi:hypothetical protein
MDYEIRVTRGPRKGRLIFASGDVAVDTDCWWDPDVRISPGTYTGYATRMATKNDGSDGGKREAIWLGKDVPYGNGTRTSDGIFIHKGTSPSWSDGCIVIAEDQVVKMWLSINPKERPIVAVEVIDA